MLQVVIAALGGRPGGDQPGGHFGAGDATQALDQAREARGVHRLVPRRLRGSPEPEDGLCGRPHGHDELPVVEAWKRVLHGANGLAGHRRAGKLEASLFQAEDPEEVVGERAVRGRPDRDLSHLAPWNEPLPCVNAMAIDEVHHEPMVRAIVWVYNQSMGRPSMREQRRAEIVEAFARVLAEHGYAGATIAAVADEAGVAPGLVHHYFADKSELLDELVAMLTERFAARVRESKADDPLAAYVDAALRLDGGADTIAARCWVGVLAEAVRDPALFARVRKLVDSELEVIQRRSRGTLSERDAGAVLAFIVGALVLGAFAPRKTAGFAAPALHALVEALR